MPFDNAPVDSDVTKQLIEGYAQIERGWCRYELQNQDGEVCALGALGYRLDTYRDFDCKAVLYLWRALPSHSIAQYCGKDKKWKMLPVDESARAKGRAYDIAYYNNDRNKEDVLQLFRKAIELSRVEEKVDVRR